MKRKSHYRDQASKFDLMKRIEDQGGLNGILPVFADHTLTGYVKSAPSRQFIKLKYGY